MPVYMVERELPGIEMEQLAAAQKAAIETSNQFTADGKPVRYKVEVRGREVVLLAVPLA